jgi:catechol 2,3-dioxygenase-like lactoylglutathione lyase family enzyme
MMFAKINHVAIVSQQYALLANFYQSVFGMRTSPNAKRTVRAITVGDGYVGLNINPRKAGRPAALDHFGVEVEDVATVLDRIKTKYPGADWIERPSTRPFAGITANDPDGNIFDLSQRKMENRSGIYVENDGTQNERCISHVAMRTMRPDEMARFYSDVLQLEERNAAAGDPNHYLTDGKVTLVIMPWRIRNFAGQSILPTGMDHFGFTVESVAKVKEDLEEAIDVNPIMNPVPLGRGKEGGARLEMARRQAPYADDFISDPDFTLVSISGRH